MRKPLFTVTNETPVERDISAPKYNRNKCQENS
jgi:hypothetical protein